MRDELRRLRSQIFNAITRGVVTQCALGAKRAILQATGLATETKAGVELFLPYGMSAYPLGGEDVILLQVAGTREHLVALFADSPAMRITDLLPGEFGLRDRNGQQIVFRGDRIEITSPNQLVITTPNNVTVNAGQVYLGSESGAKKIARDGDPVVGGTIQASTGTVFSI